MKYIRMIVLVVFLLLVIIVAVQNHASFSTKIPLGVDFVFYSYPAEGESLDVSVYRVTLISFLVGIVFAGLYGVGERFHLKRRIRMLQKEAREKDKELNSLRNLPVTTEADDSDPKPEIQ